MKNIILSLTLFSLMFFQSCDNTMSLPEGPSFFDFTYLYPNPFSIKDTLTVGLDFYKYDIKYSVLEDFKIIIGQANKRDTLTILGLYDNSGKMGIFNSDDEKVQAIMFESKITLQCIMDSNQTGNWSIKVVNNNYTTSSKVKILIF